MFKRYANNDLLLRGKNMNVSKTSRLLEALQRGEQLTAKQIQSRFEIANPTATVSSLRFNGFAVYANKLTNKRGETSTKYRLGSPSRAVVAAGYRALAEQGVAV